MRVRPRHVRTRLTLWYAGVLSAVLTLYAGVTWSFLYLSLHRELDANLHAEYEETEEHVRGDADGAPRFIVGDADRQAMVELWDSSGALVYRSPRLGADGFGVPAGGPPPALASMFLRDGTPVRIRSGFRHVGEHRVSLRVGMSEEGLQHELRRLGLGILLGLPLAVAIAGLGGHWLAGRALAPLGRMAREAERLTSDNLGERLTVENADDELGYLARVFNLSLGRIEESFAQLKRFTADASHELRTPLTAIRAVGEVALQDQKDGEHYRETIGSMLEEVDRLSRLVDSLLVLSRADAGPHVSTLRVDLLELVKGTASLLEILAEERNQTLEVHGEESLTVEADPLLLRQALVNLIDNAIKYSPPGSKVRLAIRRSNDGAALIEVVDEGPGIPERDAAHVFERFYRVDGSRSREGGGSGLGLSIARWAVESQGGRIDLVPQRGPGSTFLVRLPLASNGAGAGPELGKPGARSEPNHTPHRP